MTICPQLDSSGMPEIPNHWPVTPQQHSSKSLPGVGLAADELMIKSTKVHAEIINCNEERLGELSQQLHSSPMNLRQQINHQREEGGAKNT